MPDFLLGSKTVTLRPAQVAASGGEADIYRTGDLAFKVFKPPSHPEVKGQPQLEHDARMRIAEHQQKLPALMALKPRLPRKVAAPVELLRDKNGLIAGYQMDFITPAEVLHRFGDRSFREQGVPDDAVRDVFVDLHHTLCATHPAGFTFGDFNDLNALVKGREAFIIDADSGQFGSFVARMFTDKFVDPLICDPNEKVPMMIRPHSPQTDWYAYLVMLMQSLLYVGPYGGVYRPADQKKQVPHDTRPLKRITVFNSEVRYPKPARPYKILPDSLLDLFEKTFVKDVRQVPPLSVIEGLRFTKCLKCGVTHARGACPDCVGVTAPMVREVVTAKLAATKLFETSGQVLFAAMQKGKLRYLYHEGGTYRREGDQMVVSAALDPSIRFRISGERTLLARVGQCLVFESSNGTPKQTLSVDAYGQVPLIDANGDNLFYAQNGGLYRNSPLGDEYRERIGDVLQNQTIFWVGDEQAFGFYRAAELSNFFMFHPARRGIDDSVKLPSIRGQLVDSACYFGKNRIWFFTTTQEGGRSFNRCYLLNEKGAVLGSAEGSSGDGTWLGHIRGACAAGEFLLVPTDDGAARVLLNGQTLAVDKEYQETAKYMDSGSQLFISNAGLTVVRGHSIWQLVMR